MINISINEEISSRRCLYNNANQNVVSNNRLENENIIPLGNRRLICQLCQKSFISQRDYDVHLLSCRDFRNNRMMNNINEILHLVQSINRHFQFEGRLNSLGLSGMDEPEDAFEFIDWSFNIQTEIWKNEGKINITSN